MRRRSSAPRPAATARAARASVSSTPRAAASSSSSWRSSPSRAVRAKSHPKSSRVRIEPSTIMIAPAVFWSAPGEMPCARSPAA